MLGVIHKPRGQLRGRGVSQMTILLHTKPYLVKVTTKVVDSVGGLKYPNFWPRGLWMTPTRVAWCIDNNTLKDEVRWSTQLLLWLENYLDFSSQPWNVACFFSFSNLNRYMYRYIPSYLLHKWKKIKGGAFVIHNSINWNQSFFNQTNKNAKNVLSTGCMICR